MIRLAELRPESKPDAGFSLIEMLAALMVASLVAVSIFLNLPAQSNQSSMKWESAINASIAQMQRQAVLSQKAQGLRIKTDSIESVSWSGTEWVSNPRKRIRLGEECTLQTEATGAPQIIADAAGLVSSGRIELRCGRLNRVGISVEKALAES